MSFDGPCFAGGVHAHLNHFIALAKIVSAAGVPVAIHAFLDGRDVPPQSAAEQIEGLLKEISGLKGVKLASLCGRYYAMDRDKRWDRVAKAYDFTDARRRRCATDAVAAIKESYAKDTMDEFVLPIALGDFDGMKDGDGVLFANYRTDRAREILLALLDGGFSGFARKKTVRFAAALGMAEYSDRLNQLMGALFPPKKLPIRWANWWRKLV